MSFGEAVSTGFSKYADFSGRARRSEYWYWVLFYVLLVWVAVFADLALDTEISGGVGWITLAVTLVLAIPTIAVTVRRLHDTDRSGWWWWLTALCGIGGIIVLVFCLLDGKPGANRYGPSPTGA